VTSCRAHAHKRRSAVRTSVTSRCGTQDFQIASQAAAAAGPTPGPSGGARLTTLADGACNIVRPHVTCSKCADSSKRHRLERLGQRLGAWLTPLVWNWRGLRHERGCVRPCPAPVSCDVFEGCKQRFVSQTMCAPSVTGCTGWGSGRAEQWSSADFAGGGAGGVLAGGPQCPAPLLGGLALCRSMQAVQCTVQASLATEDFQRVPETTVAAWPSGGARLTDSAG
jgi:hypothetical protein